MDEEQRRERIKTEIDGEIENLRKKRGEVTASAQQNGWSVPILVANTNRQYKEDFGEQVCLVGQNSGWGHDCQIQGSVRTGISGDLGLHPLESCSPFRTGSGGYDPGMRVRRARIFLSEEAFLAILNLQIFAYIREFTPFQNNTSKRYFRDDVRRRNGLLQWNDKVVKICASRR